MRGGTGPSYAGQASRRARLPGWAPDGLSSTSCMRGSDAQITSSLIRMPSARSPQCTLSKYRGRVPLIRAAHVRSGTRAVGQKRSASMSATMNGARHHGPIYHRALAEPHRVVFDTSTVGSGVVTWSLWPVWPPRQEKTRMMSIFSRLFAPKAALSRLEVLIVHCVQAQLNPEMATRWADQILCITGIERLPGRRTIRLHQTSRGKPVVDNGLALPLAGHDGPLAEVTVSVAGGFTPLRAVLHCQNGLLSAIEYHDDSTWMDEVASRRGAHDLTLQCILMPDAALVVG